MRDAPRFPLGFVFLAELPQAAVFTTPSPYRVEKLGRILAGIIDGELGWAGGGSWKRNAKDRT